MSIDTEPSLAEQRQSLQGQLQAHRQVVALQLTSVTAGGDHYPRSMTMRLLVQRPALVARLVALFAIARFAGSALGALRRHGKPV